jgi:hypothetical protein
MSLPKYCWIVDLESLGRWNIKAITKTEDVEVFTAETSTESSHEQQPVSNPILLGCYPIFHINRKFLASPMIFHQLVTLRAWQLLDRIWDWQSSYIIILNFPVRLSNSPSGCGLGNHIGPLLYWSTSLLVHFPSCYGDLWWSMVESQSITAITSSELGIHESCQEKHPMFKHHPSIFED